MLITKIGISENQKGTSINAYDLTSVYNNPLNLGGYGSPNPIVADATSAVLQIYQPNPTTNLVTTTVFATVDLFPTFPTTNKLTPFTITASSLGLDSFIDGEWMFKYITVINGETYPATILKMFIANVCCCSKVLTADTANCGCDNNESMGKANKVSGMIKSLQYLVGCYKNRKAAELLKTIQRICLNKNCTNCR